MTKRTNAFQKAILFIHEQLKDSETKVTESTFLYETNIDKPVGREVDVLLERVESGIVKRIAIECRDRLAKDDIIWIDGLIGKYLNLSVDKIIAVSSSGFSSAAKLKAIANKIQLRTINEIKNIDWDNEFIKIGMVDWSLEFKIQGISGETESGELIRLKSEDKIVYKADEGTFIELFQAFREGLWDKLFKEKFNKSIIEIYKTKEDLSKHAVIEHKVSIPNFQLVDNDNIIIKALVINLIGIPSITDLSTKHFDYMDSVISKTELKLDDNGALTFITAQAEPNSKINVTIDRKTKRRRSKSTR